MYGRKYGGRELKFEPSGGLLHALLVMQDKETDSFWSIMTGDALAGRFEGTRLEELPIGEKVQWRDWVARYPKTKVLSVDGAEHEPVDPYENYFSSETSYRGGTAVDDRLATKEPIYAFQHAGRAYAVPHRAIAGGLEITLGDETLWLYRPEGVAIFYSTRAYRSPAGSFSEDDGSWVHHPSGARFDPRSESFDASVDGPEPLSGFDTFWFNWSMIHRDSEVLGGEE